MFLLSLDDETVVGLMLSIVVAAAVEDGGVISKAARLVWLNIFLSCEDPASSALPVNQP